MGFTTKRNHIDYDALADAVRIHYEDFNGFTHRDRLLSTSTHPLHWLRTLVERPARSSHPVCHILLIGYLFGTVAAFKNTIHLVDKSKADHFEAQAKAEETTYVGDMCAKYDQLIRDITLSCRKVAQALKLSVTTVVCRRRMLGIPISERRKYLNPQKLKAIAKDLAHGLKPSPIAIRHRISLSSVYRLRAQSKKIIQEQMDHDFNIQLQKQRKHWQKIIEMPTCTGITSARNASPDSYSWLYRHDRVWLKEKNATIKLIPIKRETRIDWAEKDSVLSQVLIAYVNSIRQNSDRPRISKSLMLRPLGEAMVRANLDKLPRLNACINKLTESRLSFQMFKIDRAIDDLVKNLVPLRLWRIQRAAGIKYWSASLQEYANQRMLKSKYPL